MILQPGENFVIARGLGNHMDTDTSYVRATVRNARTDELLKTVNLTDNGSRRFTAAYQVPGDPSGLGFYILITTTVYSDPTYETKSVNYEEEFHEYLVDDRHRKGGGGGVDIDYKKIAKIFAEAIGLLPVPDFSKQISEALLSATKDTSSDISLVKKELSNILLWMRSFAFPEQKKVDLSPVSTLISSIGHKITAAISDMDGAARRSEVADIIKSVSSLETMVKGLGAEIGAMKEKEVAVPDDLAKKIDQVLSMVPEPPKPEKVVRENKARRLL